MTKLYSVFYPKIDELFHDLSWLNLEDYSDDKWCYNYTTDEYFLYILCWAYWRDERQEQVWSEVRSAYSKIGKELHQYGPIEYRQLSIAYPLVWQKEWLENLRYYLKNTNLTTQSFVGNLKNMEYEKARDLLQIIMDTNQEKIVGCWLRDIVKMDAFPIDLRVKNVLDQYEIPAKSSLIIEYCKEKKVPVRPLARAVYDKSKDIMDRLRKRHEEDCKNNKHVLENYDYKYGPNRYILGWKVRCKYCKVDMNSDIAV